MAEGEMGGQCGKVFMDEKHLMWHRTSVHNEDEVKCPDCSEILLSKRKMWNHRKKHECWCDHSEGPHHPGPFGREVEGDQ